MARIGEEFVAPTLIDRLNFYKLRAKVTVRDRTSESHASTVIEISTAQRRSARSTSDPNDLGFDPFFFEEASFVRQSESHKLAAQIRDTDSNLVRRMGRGLENKYSEQTRKKFLHSPLSVNLISLGQFPRSLLRRLSLVRARHSCMLLAGIQGKLSGPR